MGTNWCMLQYSASSIWFFELAPLSTVNRGYITTLSNGKTIHQPDQWSAQQCNNKFCVHSCLYVFIIIHIKFHNSHNPHLQGQIETYIAAEEYAAAEVVV